MTLSPGSRLGPYEIVARLGAGGMGEVFKARDPRLERSVAIKVLPADFEKNEQLKARFEREAKTISQLSHPHICTVHDFGRENGTTYLVMELLEGESLADRLGRGPIAVADVLRYGAQIATALDLAHRAGVVHRDLKPGNVMITRGGAKLLDFGLARTSGIHSTTPDASTAVLTGATQIVGTLPYMAPEQLQGHEVDARTDIFAFGAVLYEMVTGRRAFAAGSPASLVASILERDPPKPSELQSVTPPALEHVILTCLQKDPEARFQSAADIAHQLRWLASTPQAGATESRSAHPRVGVRPIAIAVALGAIAVMLAGLAAYQYGKAADSPSTVVFTQLTFDAGEESHPTISPDGKMFAFAKTAGAGRDIFLQRIDGRSAINLTNTPDIDDSEPAFSPDGNLIAFRSSRDGGGIFVMGATGESPRRVTDKGFSPSWAPDGKQIVASASEMRDPAIVFGIRNAYVADVATGATRVFYDASNVMQPVWSPNGHRVAFWTATKGQRDIFTIAASGEPDTLIPVTTDVMLDWNPIWSPDGKHLYFSSERDGTMNLWRIAIDEESGRTRGAPEPIRTPSVSAGLLSITHDGRRILYRSKTTRAELRRVEFDPATERVTPLTQPLLGGSMFVRYVAESPDGASIAFTAAAPHEDVYVMAADGSGIRQLTHDAARDRGLSWWPDGSRIVFYSNRSGEYEAWTIRPDGSGLTQITEIKGGVNFPRISPDGRRMAFNSDGSGSGHTGGQIVSLSDALPIRAGEPIPDTPRGRFSPRSWSTDGRWIAGHAYGFTGLYVYAPGSRQLLNVPVDARFGGFVDGSRILFVDTIDRIGIAEVPSMRVRYVGKLPAQTIVADDYSISATPRSMLLLATHSEADIWMADLHGRETTSR